MENSSQSSEEKEEKEVKSKKNVVIPFRPELKKVKSQQLTFFCHPPTCPYHPRTLFFYNDPELNENLIPQNTKLEDVEIKDKRYMVFYKAYKNIPLCLSEPMKVNCIIRSKLFEDTNIIWKLLKKDQMFPLLREINVYQKFNHFPMTWLLSRKDNLYNHFKTMKEKFPKEYNYMPETYILPDNLAYFKNMLGNYRITKDNLWLIKPAASSRGRGIKIMQNVDHIPSKGLITKYISNPYLINNKKFDLRLYLLITGYAPLKIYLYNNGLTRFCSEDYVLNENSLSNSYIHLTNYSINKSSVHYVNNDEAEEEEDGNKWSLQTFINHLKAEKINFNAVWDKIKDLLIKTILSVTDEAIPLIKSFNLASGNLFELYGVDVLLDANLKPWLMEVNLNPSLNCDTELDLTIKSKVITDIFNIVGVVPFSHDEEYTLLDPPLKYKDRIEEAVNESICEFARLNGGFERIFPLKENIDKYKKFINNPESENLALWKYLKEH